MSLKQARKLLRRHHIKTRVVGKQLELLDVSVRIEEDGPSVEEEWIPVELTSRWLASWLR